MASPGQERRKYLRVEAPLDIRVIQKNSSLFETKTKDISPIGLRFQAAQDKLAVGDEIELTLKLPGALNPVHAIVKVVRKRALSENTSGSSDIGCEFKKIEEDNKNTFLKFFQTLSQATGRKETKKENGGA